MNILFSGGFVCLFVYTIESGGENIIYIVTGFEDEL